MKVKNPEDWPEFVEMTPSLKKGASPPRPRPEFVEATPSLWEPAGPKARLYSQIVSDCIERNGGSPSIEFTLTVGGRGKSCDICDLATMTEFEIQIYLTHMIENITKNAAVGFKRTIVVVEDRKEKEKTERELPKILDPWDLETVEVKTISEFLP